MGYGAAESRKEKKKEQPDKKLVSEFLRPRAKGNAPIVMDRNVSVEKVAAKYGISTEDATKARQKAALMVANTGTGEDFNPLAVTSDLRFEDISEGDQRQAYRTVLGRGPTDGELQEQQGNSIKDFVYGAKPELKTRRDMGETAAGEVLDIIGDWGKSQKGPGLGRQFLEMGSIAASLATGGTWGVVIAAGSTLGFAAYDESQGYEVDWGRTVGSAALTVATRSNNPVTRAAVSAGAGYATTGDFGDAAILGAVGGVTTGQRLPYRLAGEMLVNKTVNDQSWASVMRKGGMQAAISSLPSIGGTDYSMMARMVKAVHGGNPGEIVGATVGTAVQSSKGPAKDRKFGAELTNFTFERPEFKADFLSTYADDGRQALPSAIPVRRANGPKASPRPAAPVPSRPPVYSASYISAPAPDGLENLGVVREGYESYGQ